MAFWYGIWESLYFPGSSDPEKNLFVHLTKFGDRASVQRRFINRDLAVVALPDADLIKGT